MCKIFFCLVTAFIIGKATVAQNIKVVYKDKTVTVQAPKVMPVSKKGPKSLPQNKSITAIR